MSFYDGARERHFPMLSRVIHDSKWSLIVVGVKLVMSHTAEGAPFSECRKFGLRRFYRRKPHSSVAMILGFLIHNLVGSVPWLCM